MSAFADGSCRTPSFVHDGGLHAIEGRLGAHVVACAGAVRAGGLREFPAANSFAPAERRPYRIRAATGIIRSDAVIAITASDAHVE
ncbi:hypothetical protein [Longimicrobium sp.]|uniref:hypothetical protein n=1 Tax=Longimicrobium sp. TaxID=2029185 RepID=UPI002E363BE2|nr:hypothetical protein [Longimicrobium sp.]HEX6042149.1 hypothetical protein [Longimicrobium sp.]